MNKVKEFKNQYDFLSNFYLSEIEVEGDKYPSVEHAYQALKTENLIQREMIRKALEFPYMKFDTRQEAFAYIKERLLIKPEYWKNHSGVLNMQSEKIQYNLNQFY